MDAFMKDVFNVKPVVLKQNALEMDAFQQRLFNSQRETYFLLKPDAPKTNAFHVNEASSFKTKCPRNGCLSAETFEFSA